MVTVADGIASLGQKPITFAYRDFNQDEFDNLYNTHQKFETEESRFHIESQLTLVATIGLIDPLRDGCIEAINNLYDAGTNTRILSGDHKESVLKTARDIGIADSNNEDGVISGEKIRSDLMPLLDKVKDEVEGGYTYKFKTSDAASYFKKNIKKNAQVLYRATPEDKEMFAAALKESGSVCALTGEGINDALALSEASVGFAMG